MAKEQKSSVKQKIAGIEKKKSEVSSAVKRLHSSIKEQERVNAAAVAQIGAGIRKVQDGIKETTRVVQAAVNKQHANIRAQVNANKAAVAKIGAGTKHVIAGINAQASENSAYIREFWG